MAQAFICTNSLAPSIRSAQRWHKNTFILFLGIHIDPQNLIKPVLHSSSNLLHFIFLLYQFIDSIESLRLTPPQTPCHRPWLIGGKHLFAKGHDSLIRQSLMWVVERQRAPPNIRICFIKGSSCKIRICGGRRPHTIRDSYVELIDTSAGWISCT